jgi:hypothetical protein
MFFDNKKKEPLRLLFNIMILKASICNVQAYMVR